MPRWFLKTIRLEILPTEMGIGELGTNSSKNDTIFAYKIKEIHPQN